jgi:hypothetical protein
MLTEAKEISEKFVAKAKSDAEAITVGALGAVADAKVEAGQVHTDLVAMQGKLAVATDTLEATNAKIAIARESIAKALSLPALEAPTLTMMLGQLYAVRDGKVLTPDFGMLEGITRQTMIDLCAKLGIPCEVRKVSAEEFREADEIFITSTSGGVMPVTRFEGRILGNGAPGPVTSKLKETYWAWHNEAAETEPVNS